jgi:tRNA-splicing ligase RtcB
MKKCISSEKFPIKMWLDDVEKGALDQAMNLANLPFAFKHVALMPDCHQGYGMPIGGVLATKNVVIPEAVGVDIGCGVACCRLPIKNITKEQIKQIFGGSKTNKGGIRSLIPVDKDHHKEKQDTYLMPKLNLFSGDSIIYDEFESARKQLGTLGGGNHFIEIQKGSDEHIYIMIHSGSRNLGFKVANHYNKIAKELNTKWFSSVDPKWDLAFLPVDSYDGQAYISEMRYCMEFAKASRSLMINNCLKCFEETGLIKSEDYVTFYDVAHNYAALENHFGHNVWIHRKGATQAYEGNIGLIPGSQGSSSYIVKGLGNEDSFKSCSHGAGRLFSRTKAKKILNLEEEISKMDAKGIVHGIRHKNDLDEASSAYKDIDEVMKNQSDLVEVVTKLTPLGVIKG